MTTSTHEAGGAGAQAPAPPPRPARPWWRSLEPLLWCGPAILLILLVVIWPVFEMLWASTRDISSSGVTLGGRGLENYTDLFDEEALGAILVRTVVWVVGVVAVTVVLSLGIAQLLNARFPGRRLVRWAVIVPWAASVVMTALIWKWMLNNFFGVVNKVLMDLGLLDQPKNWLADPGDAFMWMMWVAVFVSLPFTSYVILAGLQTIPGDVYEAARVDGAGPIRAYFRITLPLLRPALLIAVIINVINVFNNFPIIWVMTQGGPGNDTDTTTTFMYKLKSEGQVIGESAAMAVVNFALLLILVLLYLRAVRWRREIQS